MSTFYQIETFLKSILVMLATKSQKNDVLLFLCKNHNGVLITRCTNEYEY